MFQNSRIRAILEMFRAECGPYDVGSTDSREPTLIIREIILEKFQSIWSQINNVTDGRTDRQTDRQTDDMQSQDRALH